MVNLKIDEQTAKRLYAEAVPEFKAILESSFGKEVFSQKITDRVQNWQDILDISGIDPKTMQLRPSETDDELAYREWKLLSSVYNEGTILNASDTSQLKWFVWPKTVFNKSKPLGFGLAYDGDCAYWCASSGVGVRLCFKQKELALDAFNKFTSIAERLLIR